MNSGVAASPPVRATGRAEPFGRAAVGPAHVALGIADQDHAAEVLDDALEQPDFVALEGRSGIEQAVVGGHDLLPEMTESATTGM